MLHAIVIRISLLGETLIALPVPMVPGREKMVLFASLTACVALVFIDLKSSLEIANI